MLKRRFRLVTLMLTLVFAFASFGFSVFAEAESAQSDEMLPLSDWNGDWPGYASLFDLEELQPFFTRLAELEFKDPVAAIEEQKAAYMLEFDHFIVENDTIKLTKDGAEISNAVYTPVGIEKSKYGKHDLTWYVFTSEDPNAAYKNFVLMPAHGDDFQHIHFRFGNEPVAELMAREDWWPTAISSNMSVDDLVEYYEKAVEEKEEEVLKNKKELSVWDGKWNNAASFVDAPELKDVYTQLAELEGKTYEELIAGMKDRYAIDFDQMIVDGEKITFVKGGEETTGSYVSAGIVKHQNGRRTSSWNVFKAVDDSAPYETLIMFEPHGSNVHIHFRYGGPGETVQELVEKKDWMPTMYLDEVTVEDLLESQEKKLARAIENAEAKVELSEWAGDWNNMGAYLDDEELQAAFVTLAENEKVSQEEAKNAYVLKRQTDFGAIRFEGDEVIFFDAPFDRNGVEIARGKYVYSSVEKTKEGKHDLTWYAYKTSDVEAPYTNLLLMKVHGEDLVHYHLRYGDESVKKLLEKDGWFPTMIATDSTVDDLIAEITE